jgi:hypothetical protein
MAAKRQGPSFRPNLKLSHLVYEGGRSQHYDASELTVVERKVAPPDEAQSHGKNGQSKPGRKK